MAMLNPKKLYCPILKYLSESSSDRSLQEIKDEMAKEFNLSEAEENERQKSGQKKLENKIGWALYHLELADLQERPSRGKYRITAKGKNLRADDNKIIELATLAKKEKQEKLRKKRKGDKEGSPETQEQQPTSPLADIADEKDDDKTPEERIEEACQEHESRLIGEVLETITRMDSGDFERLTELLLKEMGYGQIEPRKTRGPDGGIDGIINQDALGLERVYIQAKRWTDGKVPSTAVDAFSGALGKCGAKKGVFITTSIFTDPAKEAAKDSLRDGKVIILIGREELAELMIEHKVGVVTKYTPEIKKVDENFFADGQ